jgi:hypothetical protein
MPRTVTLDASGVVVGKPEPCASHGIRVGEREFAISPGGLRLLRDDPEQRRIFVACALSFRAFLDHWQFIPEGQPPTLLGANLWTAQDIYVRATESHDSIYFLKARQLGESTIACAFDGWRMRFGPVNARVSILAQTDENSKEFLRQVVYGLEHLPPALRLPVRALEHTASLDAGKGDTRRIRSYPASNAIRSGSFSHVHLDEWAAMLDPAKVWRAVEESIVPGGTCHALTTGVGGADFTGDEWRRAEERESRFHPLFVGALERPDRTPEWYEQKRRTTDAQTLRQELPLTPEDALAGAGEYRFDAEAIELCTRYSRGLRPWEQGRRYLIAVDPGERDGTAICVLDCTGDRHAGSVRPVVDVTGFRLMRPCNLREAQIAIEQISRDFPTAPVVVEVNGIGIGLVRNLRIPSHRLYEHTTSQLSKRRMISNLAVAVQTGEIAWNASQCPDLDREMRGYKTEDANIHQDCVMALGIGLDNTDLVYQPSAGRIGKVVHV